MLRTRRPAGGCPEGRESRSVLGMSRPDDLVGTPLPDVALPAADGAMFRLRGHVGVSALVLFFIIRSGTPG